MPGRLPLLSFAIAAMGALHACTTSPGPSERRPEDAGTSGDDARARGDEPKPSANCSAAAAGAPSDDPFRRARTTEDQPDDAPGEYQVHAVYAVPSDGATAKERDVDGSIRRTMTAWNGWMSTRLGGPKLRLDTCGGVLDVTYVELPAAYTELEMAKGTALSPGGTSRVRDRLQTELIERLTDPKKLLLVFYDGLAFGACGGASLPPSLVGRVTALYLGGIFLSSVLAEPAAAGATQLAVFDAASTRLPTTAFAGKLGSEAVSVTALSGNTITLSAPLAAAHAAGEILTPDTRPPDCRTNPFSRDGVALGYTEYAGVHEVLHALGIVSSAAPHHSTTAAPGHLSKSSAGGTFDLMYQGPEPWTCAGNDPGPGSSKCVLDPAHENYVMLPAGSPALDLTRSSFLDPAPTGAAPPPGW